MKRLHFNKTFPKYPHFHHNSLQKDALRGDLSVFCSAERMVRPPDVCRDESALIGGRHGVPTPRAVFSTAEKEVEAETFPLTKLGTLALFLTPEMPLHYTPIYYIIVHIEREIDSLYMFFNFFTSNAKPSA